ncbi:MAG: hypothetical protein ABJE10_05240 [bacterium]
MYTLAHLHLLLNHIPIIVPPLGLLLLALAWLRRDDLMARIGLAFIIGGAVAALPSYFTGDSAEHAVIRAPGVTRAIIHQHEDAALIGSIVLGVVALFAAWVLWRYRRPVVVPRGVITLGIIGALAASGWFAWVGLLGGAIRHTEMRLDPPPAFGVTDTIIARTTRQ